MAGEIAITAGAAADAAASARPGERAAAASIAAAAARAAMATAAAFSSLATTAAFSSWPTHGPTVAELGEALPLAKAGAATVVLTAAALAGADG